MTFLTLFVRIFAKLLAHPVRHFLLALIEPYFRYTIGYFSIGTNQDGYRELTVDKKQNLGIIPLSIKYGNWKGLFSQISNYESKNVDRLSLRPFVGEILL